MNDTPTATIINNPPPPHSQDHDLLIKLDTKLDRAISDIKDLKDDTIERITAVENEKLATSVFETYCKQVEKDREAAQNEFLDYKDEAQKKYDSQQEQIDFANNIIRYGLGALGLINFALGVITVYKLFY